MNRNPFMTTGTDIQPLRDLTHPVWDVYDEYRTARLNVKYYSGRVHWLSGVNVMMEFMIAAFASSSAVAGFTLWSSQTGKVAWQILAGIAATLAILKPLLRLTEKIKVLEEIIVGYRVLEHDLRTITVLIKQRRTYDEELRVRFAAALERMGALAAKSNENYVDRKLKRRCQAEVAKELPGSSFYVPTGYDMETDRLHGGIESRSQRSTDTDRTRLGSGIGGVEESQRDRDSSGHPGTSPKTGGSGSGDSSGSGSHWPEMTDDTKRNDPPMEHGGGSRQGDPNL
jgi:uncharacterized membrane protein YgcG